MNENSASSSSEGFDSSRRPSLNVEEVPTTLESPDNTSSIPAEATAAAPPITETIPRLPELTPSPGVEAAQPPVAQTEAPFMPTHEKTLVPKHGQRNILANEHPAKALLFLVPAVLIIATIYFVANLTGNNYKLREPEPTITPAPTIAPTPAPTTTPQPLKLYKNEGLLIQMQIPADYEILLEGDKSVSLGRAGVELFVVRTDELTDYDQGDTAKVTIGGREAVEFALDDEGSVKVKIIQTVQKPVYEFAMYLENEKLASEFNEIAKSVVFLADTSDWETFDNTTYDYTIKYPKNWSLTAAKDKQGEYSDRSEISKDKNNKTLNNLVIQASSNLENAAFTASEIISSTRTLSGWTSPPKIELKKLGGGDAQVIQGELSGKWRAYVVFWYKNTVIQMTWEDSIAKPEQETFSNILASFEFTN